MFRCPADDAFMVSNAVVFNEHRGRTKVAASRSINVLIVDDDVNARARVRTVLGATDVDVVVREAADGIAAVHGIRDDRPDLLVLDLQMPRLDGLGVLRLLKDWPADLKPHFIAVVSTCKIDPWLTAGVLLLGADGVYPKPLLCADAERILDSLGERALRAA